MPNFDYNAPAELFLAKPRRAVARNIAVSKQRLRPFVTPLRTYARPKPSERGLRSGDERFNSGEIQRLYEAADYPLRKPE
jgi:hypothetical protein